jgi:hypothetical protein
VDVSKLIDLQNFIRTRHLAYQTAVQRVADMKRDLVRAQVANPDLQTALEVLTTGRVSNMPEVSIDNCISFHGCSIKFLLLVRLQTSQTSQLKAPASNSTKNQSHNQHALSDQ